MISIPITEQARQQERNIISAIARNNCFPLQIIHNLKNELLLKTQKQKAQSHKHNERNGSHLLHHSPIVHEVTSLFKSIDLNIAFRACNTIYNKLCDRIPLNKINSSGICKLQCKTCNKSYVGQIGCSIEIRHREHTRYIQTNDPISAYALNMLNNRHEYGSPKKKTLNY